MHRVSRGRPESHSPGTLGSSISSQEGPGNPESPPLSSCPSWHLCLATPAWPPPLLHPAGQSTHSSQTRLTSLHSHRHHHSGRCRGCSGRRHTGTPPGCRGVLALLRLEGMGEEGHTLRPGQRRGALTPPRAKLLRQGAFLPQVKCNRVSAGMALTGSHTQRDLDSHLGNLLLP